MVVCSFRRMAAAIIVGAAAFGASALLADTTFTPADESWGTALTVAEGETVVIDGGQDAIWSGAVTVSANAVLKTRGAITISGTVTVAVGGTLDVESGVANCVFGSRTMSGSLVVRSGAEIKMNRSDACNYHAGFTVHVYGTFNAQTSRTSVGLEDAVYFHDGARIIGAGDGNGAFDFFDNGCQLFVDGNVACDAPLRARVANYNLNVTCFENAHVNFAGGFAGSAGIVRQVAATAEEGNASGTCANAFIEVGANPSMTGKFVFISPAAISLKGETQTFTVETSAAELEVRANGDVAHANHVLVQKLPAITTSTATVHLVGDGVCAFLDAAPTFPVVFAGASLAIADGAPVALVAGSSVAADTLIGVEGLAANAAATLFTNAEATFDVSKITVKAMHNTVLLGTAAAATLADGTVSTAGVPDYDDTAWLMPFIKTCALIWLDASDAANFTFKDKTFGYVAGWTDLSSYKRNAKSYMANYGSLDVADGVPAYLMGAVGAQIDMNYTRMTGIRTVFEAMAIRSASGGFNQWLGDSSACHFHRNTDGSYDSQWGMQDCLFYKDGELVDAPRTTVPPADRHVYTIVTSGGAQSDQLSRDRGTNARSSGRDLSELIVFDRVLSDADRQLVEAYLAAKWMGESPTAAGTGGTYVFKGDLEVDGTVGGAVNLAFADGASISVANPATEGAMVSTTGTVTIPSGSTLTVDVDARLLPLGTYTVMQAAGGITSVSQFAAAATTAVGTEATFSVADGKLLMTISVAAASTTSITWRAQDASDLSFGAANWLYSDGTTIGAFFSYLPTFFDGGETAAGDIVVNDAYPVGPMSITGARDYTFTGTGTLSGSDPIVIDTTGTVVLDGPNLTDQTIIISNGTLRVGNDAGAYALGTRAGEIKIAGGTLDVNTKDTSEGRGLITHRKKIELSRGGRIVNNNSPNYSTIGNLSVLDTGTLGGSQRFDVRVNASDAECTTTTVDGDANAVLNVDTTTTDAIGFYNAIVNIGRINVLNGKMRIEQTAGEYNVPNGIHVADGAILGYYGGISTTGATVNVDSGTAQIQAESGTSTMKGQFVVASGATAQLAGGSTLNYEGGIQNDGVITATGGTHNFMSALNEGAVLQTAGGTIGLATGFTADTVTASMTSGGFLVKEGMNAKTVNVSGSAGSYGFMPGSAPAPVFETYNINTTGGAFDIRPQAAGILDVGGTVNVDQSAGDTYVYGPNVNNEYGIALKLVGSVASMSIGLNSSRPGTLKLKEGSDISTKFLNLGDKGSTASRGRLIIDSGAKVTIREGGDVRNGHWHSAPATVSTHVIDVAGELDSSLGMVYNPMDAPRAEMYLREGGVLKAKGLNTARRGSGNDAFNATYEFPYGNGVGAGEGRNWFIMEGGRLELGSGGIYGTRIPGVTKYDFRNGEIVNVAAWGGTLVESGERGGDYGFPMFFGYDTVGGAVTFDLGEYSVAWNTGLSGTSDVTLKGAADFQGDIKEDRLQGVMLGKLTVQNTGANDLRVTSAFAGGLTLAPGVNAQVAKYGEESLSYAVVGNQFDYAVETAWSYPYIAPGFFQFAYKKFSTSPISARTSLAARGEFYVPQEKAGVWTFAGNYDDYIRLDIDGTQLLKTTTWNAVGRGTVELAAGWHKFTIAVHDGGQPGGPSVEGWGDGKGLGFYVGETDATAAGNYTTFEPGADLGDGTKLQVRPSPNVAVWSYCSAGYTDWPTREDWAHIKCVDTLEAMYKNSAASDASAWQSYVKAKTNKFEGWFKVENDKAGDWAFSVCYDDYSLFKIDGVEVARSTAWNKPATCNVNLSVGWHRWEVRVAESGGGGWGPDAAQNSGHTLHFTAPGETEIKRFDENNLTLAATLGDIAVLEPTGIYKELDVGEGATLTSDGTMAMPIYGTLKGTGSLAGAFAFAGDVNGWEVTGVDNKRELATALFADATPATFQGLKNVKAVFNAKPKCAVYYFAGEAPGITNDDVADATVTVTDGEKDYSGKFKLVVRDGRLALANASPGGMAIFLR